MGNHLGKNKTGKKMQSILKSNLYCMAALRQFYSLLTESPNRVSNDNYRGKIALLVNDVMIQVGYSSLCQHNKKEVVKHDY